MVELAEEGEKGVKLFLDKLFRNSLLTTIGAFLAAEIVAAVGFVFTGAFETNLAPKVLGWPTLIAIIAVGALVINAFLILFSQALERLNQRGH